jgi:hypothetical protein
VQHNHSQITQAKESSMTRLLPISVLAFLATLAGCSSHGSARPASASPAAATQAGIEDIFVVRSLRQARAAPGDFCAAAKIGFAAKMEDHYVFKAVLTREPDGKVVDASSHQAGTLHACFDVNPGSGDANFYAEGVIAGVSATGKGKCLPIAADFPEPGIISTRCFLILSNLSAPYIAGVLTTNSVSSRQPIGDQSDPPGYTQPSIATIRLWRKR